MQIAADLMNLAELDCVVQAGVLPERFDEATNGLSSDEMVEVKYLEQLLAAVLFERIASQDKWLNPTLGVGRIGVDADIISSGCLIDIKAHKQVRLSTEVLNQLLGYFLLSRRQRSKTSSLPEIDQVGVYFARHAYLWTLNTSEWLAHAEFAEVEREFERYLT